MTRSVTDLLNLREMEAAAAEVLSPAAFAYYTGGANDELTLRANREGYARLRLRPRVLVDVSHIDTSTEVLGLPLAFPVGVAPCAMHGLVHPDAEVATARAAASVGSLITLSTMSHRTIEDVSRAAAGQFWFQLYLYKDREVSRALVQRAEAAGARALVLTVDAPVLGRREAIIRTPVHIEPGTVLPNIGPRTPGSEHLDDLSYFDSLLDPALTWRDIAWLRGITGLPIVLKGILTAEDFASTAATSGPATTAGGSSTRRSRRSTPCPKSRRRRRAAPRSIWTAASHAAPMSSRPCAWGPAPCFSPAPCSTASRWRGRTARGTRWSCCATRCGWR